MNAYAPIALFVYNRLPHVKRVIQAIKKNSLSQKSIIYIFSDFSDSEFEKIKIKKIRKYLKNIKFFKKVIMIEREHNFGTSKNITHGLKQIFKKHDKCIIIEDDVIISNNFLDQMNYFLEKFNKNNKIASIEGFMYPVKFDKNLPKYFAIRGSGCWGWATWKRCWKNYENSAIKLIEKFEKNKNLIHEFNYYNSYPYYKMLKKQLKTDNSWSIKWAAGNFLKKKYTIYFKNSLVKNIGVDGSGVNCKLNYDLNQKKFKIENIIINNNRVIKENFEAKKKIAKYLKSNFSIKNKIILTLRGYFK